MKVVDVLQEALTNTSLSHEFQYFNRHLIEEYIITIEDLTYALNEDSLNLPKALKVELKRILQHPGPPKAQKHSPSTNSSTPLNTAYITPFIDDSQPQKAIVLRSPPAHKARGASVPLQLTKSSKLQTRQSTLPVTRHRYVHDREAHFQYSSPAAANRSSNSSSYPSHSIRAVQNNHNHSYSLNASIQSADITQDSSHQAYKTAYRTPSHDQRSYYTPNDASMRHMALQNTNRTAVHSVGDNIGLSRTLNRLTRPSNPVSSHPAANYSPGVYRSAQKSPVVTPLAQPPPTPLTSRQPLASSSELISLAHDLERHTQEAVAAINHLHQHIPSLPESHVHLEDDISLLSPQSDEEENMQPTITHMSLSYQTPERFPSPITSQTTPRRPEEDHEDCLRSINESSTDDMTSAADVCEEEEGENPEESPEPEPWAETAGWMEYYTEEGDLYYYNHYTEESTWDMPHELSDRRTMQAAVAHAVNICNVYHPIVVESEPIHDWHVDRIDRHRVYVTLPCDIREADGSVELPDVEENSHDDVDGNAESSTNSDSASDSGRPQNNVANQSVMSESSSTSNPEPISLRESIRRRVAESLTASTSRLNISCDSPIIEETDEDLIQSDAPSSATSVMQSDSSSSVGGFDDGVAGDAELISPDNREGTSISEEAVENEEKQATLDSVADDGAYMIPHVHEGVYEDPYVRSAEKPVLLDSDEEKEKESPLLIQHSERVSSSAIVQNAAPGVSVLCHSDNERSVSPLPPPIETPFPVINTPQSRVESDNDDASIFTYDGTVTSDAGSISRRRSGSFSDISMTPETKKMKLTKRLKNLFRRKSLTSQTP